MTDPRRLLEDAALSDVERRSLAAARAVEPPPELASQVWTDLVMALGATGAAGGLGATVGHSGPASAASGASLSAGAGAKVAVLKALALGATVGAITTGGAVALTSPPRHAAEANAVASAGRTTPEPRSPASRKTPGDVAVSASGSLAPESVVSKVPSTDDAIRTPSRTSAYSESAPASGALTVPGGAPSVRDQPAPPTGSSIGAFGGIGTEQSSAKGEADTARAEARLVGVAREALQRGEPARALFVLEETLRRFPNGILLQEREALSISALAALGRKTEAATRAGVFLRAFPNSPHAERVRTAVQPR